MESRSDPQANSTTNTEQRREKTLLEFNSASHEHAVRINKHNNQQLVVGSQKISVRHAIRVRTPTQHIGLTCDQRKPTQSIVLRMQLLAYNAAQHITP